MMRKTMLVVLCCLTTVGLLAAGCAKTEDVCAGITCSDPADNLPHGHCQKDANGQAACICNSGYYAGCTNGTCLPVPTDCSTVTCSDHGTCAVVDNKPTCSCDPSFQQVAGNPLCCEKGQCVNMGNVCTASTQCCDGYCLKFSNQTSGYCSKQNCKQASECKNNASDGKAMCCVVIGTNFSICEKTGTGCSCGDQTGMCGASCYCKMDSACDPTMGCLSTGDTDPNASCSMECTNDNDCTACQDPADPKKTFSCQAISGGKTYCLPTSNPGKCQSSLDCTPPDVCIAFTCSDNKTFCPSCANQGDLPVGAACNDADDPNNLPASQRCADFYCIHGHCTEVCTLASDCKVDKTVCSTVLFNMGSGAEASVGMCLYYDCKETPCKTCKSNADCTSNGESCSYYASPDDTVHKVCITENCDPSGAHCSPVGTANCNATGADPCFGDLCLVLTSGAKSWCSALCNVRSDCPTGMVCGLLGVTQTATTGACSLFDGSANPCTSNADCAATKEVCTYLSEPGGVESVCMTPITECSPGVPAGHQGDACGGTNQCCDNDLCIGSSTTGIYHCAGACMKSEDCGPNFICTGFQFSGDPTNKVYGSCGASNGSAQSCKTDDTCPTGEACFYNMLPSGHIEGICQTKIANGANLGDTCSSSIPCYNDLCLIPSSGGNDFCSKACVHHTDCPDGYVCSGLSFTGGLDTVGACIKATGSKTPCTSNAGCTVNGEVCIYFPPPNQLPEAICLEKVAGGVDPGATCSTSIPCANDLCLTAAYCSAVCATNTDCASYTPAMECDYIGFTNDTGGTDYAPACVKPGTDSPLCSICSIDTDCAPSGVKCIASAAHSPEKYCGKTCVQTPSDNCPTGSTCTDFSGTLNCKPNTDTCHP